MVLHRSRAYLWPDCSGLNCAESWCLQSARIAWVHLTALLQSYWTTSQTYPLLIFFKEREKRACVGDITAGLTGSSYKVYDVRAEKEKSIYSLVQNSLSLKQLDVHIHVPLNSVTQSSLALQDCVWHIHFCQTFLSWCYTSRAMFQFVHKYGTIVAMGWWVKFL